MGKRTKGAMSGTILTTSVMEKPGASCVVPTPGAVVAVLTDEYSNGTGIRVPGYSFQYPSCTWVFKYRTRKSEHYNRGDF